MSSRRAHPAQRAIVCGVVGGVLSLAAGAILVRVSLDWSDTRAYEGTATELRYIAIVCGAIAIWWGGTALSVVLAVRRWRRATAAATESSGAR